jgi:hypothetical protein
MMRAYIVTGCSRGLGLALTRRLLAQGAHVVGVARQAPPAFEPAGDAARFAFIACDLSSPEEAARLIPRALEQLGDGPFDSLCLINNAGIVTPIAAAGDYPDEEASRAIAINLTSPVQMCNALLGQARSLTTDLRILNISSGAAVSVYPGWGIYGATKAALDHFSRHVALENAGRPNPVRIASLYPGVVDTDMQSTIRASDEQHFPQRARFDALKQEGGLSTPESTAEHILIYLHRADFGSEPVIDIRNLTFSTEKP